MMMNVQIVFTDPIDDDDSTMGGGPYENIQAEGNTIWGRRGGNSFDIAEVVIDPNFGTPLFRVDDGTGMTHDYRHWHIKSAN